MTRTDEQMREEALYVLDTLIKRRGLNPKVKKYFEDGKLYYSYLTASGLIGSIDTINYDERYAKIVAEFEKKRDCLVYHAIESGDMLSLLFVDRKYSHRLNGREIFAYVHSFKCPECSEFGMIFLDSFQGALIRQDIFYTVA